MFQKKTPKPTAVEFDLEKDIKDPVKLKASKEIVTKRIAMLKGALRQGEDKKSFADAQALLHGYLAVQKVIQRAAR